MIKNLSFRTVGEESHDEISPFSRNDNKKLFL